MNNIEMEDNIYEELQIRLKESVNTYKVFGFSHIIIIGSVTDIMDSSLRSIIDGMYRRTKSHCKTDEEVEIYRQRLCKLYLSYFKKGLAKVDCLEPKLANILSVTIEKPIKNINDRIVDLRTMVAERTKRVQSLLALQSRLKTDTVLAEWVISKVEPILFETEKNLGNTKCVSPNDFLSIFNCLNRIKNSFNSLELND